MDDDFDFPDEVYDAQQLRGGAAAGHGGNAAATNQEAALSESESLASPHEERGATSALEADELASQGSASPGSQQEQQQQQYDDFSQAASPSTSVGHDSPPAASAVPPQQQQPELPGGYDPQKFAHLNVPGDVQDLFKYIGRFRPAAPELPTRLRPFIPDFIPAIGCTDEFVKVPRPDGRPDYLGLKVLDEPAAVQSDPALLNLQLRQHSRDAPGARLEVLGVIPHGDKDRKQRLAAWMASIAELHKSKPAAGVMNYSRPMPDIDMLMQEWPPELEAALRNSKLPTAQLDLDLLAYAKLVCALLDVPVHGDEVLEPLHLLFSLLLEFRVNPFFAQAAQAQQAGSGGSGQAEFVV